MDTNGVFLCTGCGIGDAIDIDDCENVNTSFPGFVALARAAAEQVPLVLGSAAGFSTLFE